jgi:tRNA threonylcarbamoyladenosine biosynthesis protein TsaE
MLEITSASAEETRELGWLLGRLLATGDLLALEGDLGSGKTTLVQGIAAGWGSPDRVTSPTFVLINVYRQDGQRLYHMDAYRLGGPAEAVDLDLDACLETGPLVVEWADRIREALPDRFMQVRLSWLDAGQRQLALIPHGRHYRALLERFDQLQRARQPAGN